MERKDIDQILRTLNIELESQTQTELTDKLLDAFHDGMAVQKKKTELAEQKASELESQVNSYKRDYNKAVKDAESLEAIQEKLTALEAQHKSELDNIQSKYTNMLIDSAIESELSKAGAINNKAVKGFIERDNLKLNEDGSVLGLSELVDKIKQGEDTAFLFKAQEAETPKEEVKQYNYVPQKEQSSTAVDETSFDNFFNSIHRGGNSETVTEGWN